MKTVPKQWDTQFEGKVIEKQETFPITLSCTCTCVVNIMYCMFIMTFLYFVSIEFLNYNFWPIPLSENGKIDIFSHPLLCYTTCSCIFLSIFSFLYLFLFFLPFLVSIFVFSHLSVKGLRVEEFESEEYLVPVIPDDPLLQIDWEEEEEE